MQLKVICDEMNKKMMGDNSRETQKQTKYVEIEHPNDNGIQTTNK